ncbi:MAG: hypothetical protein BWY82_00204 [Verrucomicrobia bacterium ADurb.Bin474]|nr:MAG: hypothetical protein BWY82_00204 [Verrucomicrobia bacterium ADurb.Bin474]
MPFTHAESHHDKDGSHRGHGHVDCISGKYEHDGEQRDRVDDACYRAFAAIVDVCRGSGDRTGGG